MKIPRFSIANLMALVVLVALNIAVVKALMNGPAWRPELSDLIVCGILPMANILALGLVPFLTRAGRAWERPRLVGFQVLGAVALFLCLAGFLVATHPIHESVGRCVRFLGLRPGPVFVACALMLLLLPQLALATLGAWLFGRHQIRIKVVIERGKLPESQAKTLVADGVESSSMGVVGSG